MLNKKFFWKSPPRIDGDAYVVFVVEGGTLKYSLPNGVVQNGAAITDYTFLVAAGNAEIGLFILGPGQRTSKYRFANDVVTAGGALDQQFEGQGSAAGNAEICSIARGVYTSPNRPGIPSANYPSANVIRYAYATDTTTAGTPLSVAATATASAGNKNFGIFRLNYNGDTNRFEYAADTRIAGASLTAFSGSYAGGCHTGNGTSGFMKGGAVSSGVTTINKIQLAANVCTQGTSLNTAAGTGGMAGTVNVSIFAVTGSGGMPSGCLYYYANDTVLTSAATFTRITGPGVCANPQGVNV